MRIQIDTDVEEYGPGCATIDISWVEPPVNVRTRWLPGLRMDGLLLILSQTFVPLTGEPSPIAYTTTTALIASSA